MREHQNGRAFSDRLRRIHICDVIDAWIDADRERQQREDEDNARTD